jgi:hypothetical protein
MQTFQKASDQSIALKGGSWVWITATVPLVRMRKNIASSATDHAHGIRKLDDEISMAMMATSRKMLARETWRR